VALPRPEGPGVVLRLPAVLRRTLRDQAEELAALLGPGEEDPLFAEPPAQAPPVPADPALARLLPSAYDETVDAGRAAAEFRRLTEADLRAGKRAAALRLAATADATTLGPADAEAWIAALNDLRLVLGSRLGLREDGQAERMAAGVSRRSPEGRQLELYALLAAVQEMLIEAVDGAGG